MDKVSRSTEKEPMFQLLRGESLRGAKIKSKIKCRFFSISQQDSFLMSGCLTLWHPLISTPTFTLHSGNMNRKREECTSRESERLNMGASLHWCFRHQVEWDLPQSSPTRDLQPCWLTSRACHTVR